MIKLYNFFDLNYKYQNSIIRLQYKMRTLLDIHEIYRSNE